MAEKPVDEFGLKFVGSWSPEEHRAVAKRLRQLPPAMVRFNPDLEKIERKEKLDEAPKNAPGDSQYSPPSQGNGGSVVLSDKGVYDGDKKIKQDHLSRSVFHEIAHSIETQYPKVFDEWKAVSGWTQAKSGEWSHSAKATFVDDYAKKNPFEDWAETFQEYELHPEIIKRRFPEKFRFIERFMGALKRGELKPKKVQRATEE